MQHPQDDGTLRTHLVHNQIRPDGPTPKPRTSQVLAAMSNTRRLPNPVDGLQQRVANGPSTLRAPLPNESDDPFQIRSRRLGNNRTGHERSGRLPAALLLPLSKL